MYRKLIIGNITDYLFNDEIMKKGIYCIDKKYALIMSNKDMAAQFFADLIKVSIMTFMNSYLSKREGT